MSKELCRICLETLNLLFIFEETNNSENSAIAEKIKEISNIQITKSDGLPQFVCTECLQKIDSFIVFKSQIKSSHEYLQTVKWKISEDALEAEEPYSVQYDGVHAALKGNFEPDITEASKSEFLEKTVKTTKLNAGDLVSSKKEQLQCTICRKILSSKCRLKCDLRLHAGKNPYRYEKSFVESNNQKVHERIRTEDNPFECKFCGKEFSQATGLKSHMRLHTGEWPYVCHICGKPFKTQSPLTYHITLHTGTKSFVCSTCKKAFKTKSDLNKHLETHTIEGSHECSVCGVKFAIASYLKTHMTTHNPESIYEYVQAVKRKICEDEVEIERPDLVQDQDVHEAVEGNFELDITAVNKLGLLEETVKSRKLDEGDLIKSKNRRQVMCSICGKLLSSKSRLRYHLRLHTGEKPYKCDKCEKSFAEFNNLKVHQRIHTGEKPLECKLCGKRFNQGTGLKSHMRLHTGECPYECHICGKRFKTQSPLTYHIRLHTGEKSFVCSTCSKAFITKSDLNKHLQTHTREKRYECSVCGGKFAVASYLKRHMKTHNPESIHEYLETVKYKICEEEFEIEELDSVQDQSVHAEVEGVKLDIEVNNSELSEEPIEITILNRGDLRSSKRRKQVHCTICGKLLASKSRLKCHLRLHAGEKQM